ncbi:molybdopterin-binding protein [Thiomicrospira sp. ALE5]|uniref:competence/damage-inducible protein A n=1 Tax=Thiomicrospira sp. ALE5 TaxID=748650 RepID=UPI0008E4291D|nr:competence/damage-inducible protein A [Thiomicrospira sp. ALE5]SFR64073.1 Predicted nucleotide-utilizing enzyme [Thiomicrospira sp. ALE5]
MAGIGLVVIGDEILSGKRQDRHLANLARLLKPRGLTLNWVRFIGDDPEILRHQLSQTLASGDQVFCCGGIGATPDDRTRQCAAQAMGLPLEVHEEGRGILEELFGEQAYPNRIKMVEFPLGAQLIPNGFNGVPGFYLQQHYFMPGFPQMAELMMGWVLANPLADLSGRHTIERAIRLIDASEAEWIDWMVELETAYPNARIFSLPHFDQQRRRSIEMGVEAGPEIVEKVMSLLKQEANRRNQAWEVITERVDT